MCGHRHVRVLPVRRLPPEPVLRPRPQPGQGEDLVALQDEGVLPGGVAGGRPVQAGLQIHLRGEKDSGILFYVILIDAE